LIFTGRVRLVEFVSFIIPDWFGFSRAKRKIRQDKGTREGYNFFVHIHV
jgi:hypothetical protein